MSDHRHFLIYKPYKMLSQFITNDRHQQNKRFLGELHDFPMGSMAVGRLDETTEGLLLITTDGKWSSYVTKSKKVDKEYYAQVDGIITQDAIEKLKAGVSISIESKIYNTLPAQAHVISQPQLPQTSQKIRDARHGPTSWLSITIHEGKFRQVRKMCGAVGFPVLRLARVRIGQFDINSLDQQTVKEVTHLIPDSPEAPPAKP